MIQLNNTIRSIHSLSSQLSSDHNSSVYSLATFLAMISSSTYNTTCSSIIIGLLMGLIIIFNKKLHAPSTRNTVIMIITVSVYCAFKAISLLFQTM
ncbi:hypothetical protein KSF78_0007842 [Schistosoma japonicum]|nr:hypothetical protein KSF78_0007842 [Schistosoma japonicum]